jgi:carboxypeptidase Q
MNDTHPDESIPTASLTVEDTELIHRFYKRKIPIVIKLIMENQMHYNKISRNAVGELKGSKFPNEILVIGGIFIK